MLGNDYGQHTELSERYRSGAKWFYWIAGLTIITSIIGLTGGGWRFFLSLGTTQLIDAIATVASESLGNATKVIAFVLDIFITAIFAGFGWLAMKRQFWAYIAGMVVFVFDGLVSLANLDWIGVIAHGVILVLMIRGYMAGREMAALERAMAQAPPEPAPQPTY